MSIERAKAGRVREDAKLLLELTNRILGSIRDQPEAVKSATCELIGAIRVLTYGYSAERLLESLGRLAHELDDHPEEDADEDEASPL